MTVPICEQKLPNAANHADATAMVFIPIVCFHSDYRQERGFHLAGTAVFTGACFAAIMGITAHKAQYALLCFAVAGIYVCIPLVLVWTSNVVSWPAEKRAVTQATVNAMGNAASIYGSFLWPSSDAPRYYPGFGATLAMNVALAVVAVAMVILNRQFPYPIADPIVREISNPDEEMPQTVVV